MVSVVLLDAGQPGSTPSLGITSDSYQCAVGNEEAVGRPHIHELERTPTSTSAGSFAGVHPAVWDLNVVWFTAPPKVKPVQLDFTN